MRRLDPTSITAFRQSDVGEYLRDVSSAQLSLEISGWRLIVFIGGYIILEEMSCESRVELVVLYDRRCIV